MMRHLGRGPTLEDAAAAAATPDRHQFASGWGLVAEYGTELRFCVIDDGWALAEVRENAHHAAFTMVSVVAVEEPLARIVGIELDGHGFHGPDYDGFHPGPVGSDLEGMAVDVHGVPHHGLVDEYHFHPFPGFEAKGVLERRGHVEVVAIDAPVVLHHSAGEPQVMEGSAVSWPAPGRS